MTILEYTILIDNRILGNYMKDLIDKLSTYNIFNYLFPGVLFAIFLDNFTSYQLIQKDPIIGVFLYYFLGSLISRIGSFVIEPLLRRFNFLKFSTYGDYIAASKLDPKIELLSEVNNMYRTLCALMFVVCLVLIYERLALKCSLMSDLLPWAVILIIFLIYIFSYRKQTIYISDRVNKAIEK